MNYKVFRIFIILLFCIFPLTACVQEILLFTGESDNWSVRYEINRSEDCGKSSGAIRYIGDELIPKKIKYSIDNSDGEVSLEEGGVFNLPFGCSNASKDSVIEAIIEWDGNSETITLDLN